MNDKGIQLHLIFSYSPSSSDETMNECVDLKFWLDCQCDKNEWFGLLTATFMRARFTQNQVLESCLLSPSLFAVLLA